MTEETPDLRGGRWDWLRADFDGRPVAFWLAVAAAIAVVVLGFGALYGQGKVGMGQQGMSLEAPAVPAVFGYYGGQEIRFIHTEASDKQVADMLTMMMGSPVLVVPSLAQIPPPARAKVYVFANGLQSADTPAGPFGFQPDVFDSIPGQVDYSPLREVVKVTWSSTATPRLLRSLEEIDAARRAGELAVQETGAVVNMPTLQWPGGGR